MRLTECAFRERCPLSSMRHVASRFSTLLMAAHENGKLDKVTLSAATAAAALNSAPVIEGRLRPRILSCFRDAAATLFFRDATIRYSGSVKYVFSGDYRMFTYLCLSNSSSIGCFFFVPSSTEHIRFPLLPSCGTEFLSTQQLASSTRNVALRTTKLLRRF